MKKSFLVIGAVLVILVAGGYIGLNHYAGRLADIRMAALEARISPYANVQHSPVSYELFTNSLRVKDVKIAEKAGKRFWTAAEVIVKAFDYQNKVPSFASVRISGIKLDITRGALGFPIPFLEQDGVSTVEVHCSFDYRYSRNDKTLTINEAAIEGVGLAKLTASLTLTGLDLPMMDNVLAILFSLPQIKLQRAELQYTDYALCDRALNYASAISKKTREEVIREAFRNFGHVEKREQVPLMAEILSEWRKFLTRPGILKLTASPAQPVALAGIQSASVGDLPALLNIKMQALER